MSSKSSTKYIKKSRDYDKESGKNRVSSKKKIIRRPPPPPESESESEVTASESEIESEYEIKVKDVHRQKPPRARSRKTVPQQDTQDAAPGEEPPSEPTVAPALDFLVAIAYRQGTSAVQFDSRSFFVIDCYTLFSAAYYICELLTPNSLVHEVDPAFMSITFYLYIGHLYYYHILRIRDSVGELTREERRCLRHYESVGPAESWPVPTPIAGILSSFGVVQPPSHYYGKIIPKLPSFTGFTAAHSLRGIHGVTSVCRVPIIPAMQQFLRNFGTATADFVNGILHPLADATLTPGAAGPPVVAPNTFLGFTASAANSRIQHLFFSSGWNRPTETEEPLANFPHALKRSLVNRFNVPDVTNTATITGIETFLGFRDGQSNAWMKNLLRSASTVCRFFPGSTNLSALSTTTQEEFITQFTWTTAAARTARDDAWFRGRNLWTYSFNGKVHTENSGYLYKAAASSSPNAGYLGNIIPAVIQAQTYSNDHTGPYFLNPAGHQSLPLTLVESAGQPDPTRNMLTFMDEKLYDNLGGRARS